MALYVREKNSVTRGLGKKNLTQTKLPIPRYKVKWWAPYLDYLETRSLINRVFNSL